MRLRRLSLAEIARRRADAARDRDLLESGWTPDERTLATAPVISDFVETVYPGTDLPALYGRCTGHPLLADGPVMTSPITARGAGWIRTEGRFYRVLERRPDPPASPVAELVEAWTPHPDQAPIAYSAGSLDDDLPAIEDPNGFVGF